MISNEVGHPTHVSHETRYIRLLNHIPVRSRTICRRRRAIAVLLLRPIEVRIGLGVGYDGLLRNCDRNIRVLIGEVM